MFSGNTNKKGKMTLEEFLNQQIQTNKKICPNCGLYQCHGIRWCYKDGGEFELIPHTLKIQINMNLEFTDQNYSYDKKLNWWYEIFRLQMKEKIGVFISKEEFEKELRRVK